MDPLAELGEKDNGLHFTEQKEESREFSAFYRVPLPTRLTEDTYFVWDPNIGVSA